MLLRKNKLNMEEIIPPSGIFLRNMRLKTDPLRSLTIIILICLIPAALSQTDSSAAPGEASATDASSSAAAECNCAGITTAAVLLTLLLCLAVAGLFICLQRRRKSEYSEVL